MATDLACRLLHAGEQAVRGRSEWADLRADERKALLHSVHQAQHRAGAEDIHRRPRMGAAPLLRPDRRCAAHAGGVGAVLKFNRVLP